MAEKRYALTDGKFHDNLTGKDYDEKMESWKICELLNNQNKTIQMLFMEKRELEDALVRRERKVKEILQRHYDAKLGNDRIIETIAEDLGIELDLW